MGELFVNHGVTSIVALENAPKALRARSQDAQDLPRFFHPGGRLQLSNDVAEADVRQMVRTWLAQRTRFRVVRAIQRPEFPRLCDRSR